MKGTFTVRFILTEPEKAAVLEFVRKMYGREYGTRPSSADSYAAVFKNGELVGCLGVQYADSDGRFRLEKVYRLKREHILSGITKKNTVQLVRWTSRESGSAMIAAYCVGMRELSFGRTRAILDCHSRVSQFIRNLGIVCQEIPNEGPDLSEVAPGDSAAYTMIYMRPYHIDLKQMCAALAPKIPDSVLRFAS